MENQTFGNAIFVPEKKETVIKEEIKSNNLKFIPSDQQPDLKKIKKYGRTGDGGFMQKFSKLVGDVAEYNVGLQLKTDISEGAMIESGVKSVASTATTYVPDVVADVVQTAGDLTDTKSLSEFGSSMKRTTGAINSFLEKNWIQSEMPMIPIIQNASRALASGGTQAVLVSGIAKPLGMVGAYLFQSAGEGAGTYLEAREAGEGKGVASTAGLSVMASNFAIDRFADPLFLAKGMKQTARGVSDILLDVSKEPTTEMLQQVSQNFISKLTYDENREYLDGIIEAGIGGLGGGIAAVSVNSMTYNPQENYDKARNVALSKGATQEELARFESIVVNELQKNNGKISEFLTGTIEENLKKATDFYNSIPAEVNYQTVDSTMKTAEQFISENEGTEEANRIRAFKTELENVYTDSLEMLKGKMSDSEAEASAKILQGRALFGSQLFGVSPSEYMKTIFPKVEKTTELDFLQKVGERKQKKTKPLDVFQAIIKMGGISPNDKNIEDLRAVLDQSTFKLLNKKTGRSLDDVREMLVQWGYLLEPNQEGEATTTFQDVLDLLEKQARGTKVYPDGYQEEVEYDIGEDLHYATNALIRNNINYENMSDEEIISLGSEVSGLETVLDRYNYSEENRPQTLEDMRQAVKELLDEEARNKPRIEGEETDPFADPLDGLDIPFQTEQMIYDSLFPEYTGETITVDGKERPVYNSEGNRIAKSKEALINFYKWFGDSKVVDEQGRPLVVYHGSPEKNIKVFDKSKIGRRDYGYFGQGFSFTPQEWIAEDYSKTYDENPSFSDENLKGSVYPVYLKIENPKYTTSINEGTLETDELKENGYDGVIVYSFNEYSESVRENDPDVKEEIEEAKKFTNEWWQLKNYDDEVVGKKFIDEIVAFEPNQIKSVENRGTFSLDEDNIYWQPAYAGSRVDYDKPSLEAIGSGEGNQAHGWGLYYALNRDVAEYYRETLSEPDISYEYDGDAKLTNAEIRIIGQYGLNKAIQMAERQLDLKIAQGYSESDIEEQKAIVEKLKFVNENDIKKIVKENKGQVHEVDIPENPYLLDENKNYENQSDYVKEKLQEFFKDKQVLDLIKREKGKYAKSQIKFFFENKSEDYSKVRELNELLFGTKTSETTSENARLLSELLYKHGIKGITYYGRQDGRCFVIFNPDDVKVIQKFYQEQGGLKRGAFDPALNTIFLFSKANRSTFMHETAHSFIRELNMLKDKSEIARSMLSHIDNWATEEFNKRYTLELKDGSYVVKNRAGLVEYNNRGRGFGRKEEAIEYAKNELFARGFEQYLRDGKAPSNYLKRAFNSFMNWLKRIYQDARELNVSINEEIKQVYSEMLGGENLDYWMSQPVEKIIEARKQTTEERNAYLDEIIKDTINGGGTELSDPKGRGFSTIWTNIAIPLSTRAERISPKVKTRLRRFEYELRQGLKEKYEKSKPFIDIWNEMSFDDSVAFDLALKNDYAEKVDEIVAKYNASEQWQAIRDVLSSVYNEAQSSGLDLGFREEYFPRKVRDVDGFMSYLHNTDEWSYFEQVLRETDPENVFTIEEKADFLNKFLRGYVKSDLLPNKYSSEKHRKIQTITRELNRYYSPSLVAYTSYLDGMNTRIESAKFLGKDADNLEESIGGYLTYLINNNIIKPSDVDEVKDILRARMNQKGVSNKWLGDLRNISYMYTMGGINSAITQIEDLSTSLYKAGVWNTLSTMFSGKQIKKSDLATDNVSVELSEPSRTARYLNGLFKITGLTYIDAFAEEVLTNATFKKYRALAEKDTAKLKTLVEPVMEGETEQTIQDIKNGDITDNVKFLMFNAVSDVKPVSLSELPAYYNTSGNMRVAYMLKSFAVKRIDIFRNECFDKLRSNDFETRKQGLQNLFKLSVLMVLCGATKDWIIDLLYGRKTDVSERLLNNIISLSGLSKYHIYKTKEQGFTGTLKEVVVPPIFSLFDDLFTDVAKSSQGKRDFKDYEVLKGIPLVGRFYYWHIGRGKEKQKKKRGSSRR